MKKFFLLLILILFALSLVACTGETTPDCSHVYGEWRVTKDASLNADGVETRYCNNCQNSETRSINMLFTLNASASNSFGVVQGAGDFSWGKQVTVSASSYNGCEFLGWYLNEEKVCDEYHYTFIMPKNNVDLIAKFEKVTYDLSIYVNNNELGSVDAPKKSDKGESVTITATPIGENVFEGWYMRDELVSTETSYTFEMPDSDCYLKAIFSIPKWDGSVATSFSGGTGSLTNPYRISTGKELAYLASLLSNESTAGDYFDKAYALTADIDLNYHEWLPIGIYDTGENSTDYHMAFYGTFFGQGYVVKNLKITTLAKDFYKNFGLFGCISNGTVKNLHIENAEINVENRYETRAGLLAGRANNSTIVNCSVKGNVTVNIVENSPFAYAGGLIATIDDMNINACSSEANVKVTSEYGATSAGGLIAKADKDFYSTSVPTLTNVYAKGNVEANSLSSMPAYAGGIVGYGANVIYAYHVGDVYAKVYSNAWVYCGGISGYSKVLDGVYNDGNVYVVTELARPFVNLVVGDTRDNPKQNHVFAEGTRYKNGVKYTYVDYLDKSVISGPSFSTKVTFFTNNLEFNTSIWNCYYVEISTKSYPTLIIPKKEVFLGA